MSECGSDEIMRRLAREEATEIEQLRDEIERLREANDALLKDVFLTRAEIQKATLDDMREWEKERNPGQPHMGCWINLDAYEKDLHRANADDNDAAGSKAL